MRPARILIPCLFIVSAVCMATSDGETSLSHYTAEFGIQSDDAMVAHGGNKHISLNPGTYLRLEGEDDHMPVQVEFLVLEKTKKIRLPVHGGTLTVKTRVVEEREWVDGVLSQVSYHFLAGCPRTGNVYNFGEKVQFDATGAAGLGDNWVAGKNGAAPGLLMPGTFLIGSRYMQAQAPGVSMEGAKNIATGVTVETPAGVFENCVIVRETSLLEPDEEVLKTYAPGVGLIVDDGLQLVEFHQ